MSQDDQTPRDYEVGYGKTPTDTRWKPGRSGNPTGKRKREETLREKLRRIASEEIVVSQNGVKSVMTQDEAMLRSALGKAIKGDVAALKLVMASLGADEASTPGAAPLVIGPADLAVLRTHADWVGLIERAKADLSGDAASGIPQEDESDDNSTEHF